MAEKKYHIDRTFKGKLKNFSETAPPDVWEGVAGALDHDRQRSRLFLIARIAAAAAIIISVGTAYLFLRNPADKTRQAEEIITAPAGTAEQSPVTGEQQVFISGTKEDAGDEPGREVIAGGKNRVEQDNCAFQQTIADEGLQASGLYLSSLSGGQEGETGELLAVADLQDMPGIKAGFISTDGSGMNRINALREMPEYEIAVPSDELQDDAFVLIDEFTPDNDTRYDRWAVGTQVSPVYSYRDLGRSGQESNALTYYSTAESGMMAYAGGVNLSYLPAKRLTVQSGLYYSKMGISIDHSYVSANVGPESAYSDAFKYNTISNSSGVIQTGSGNIEAYYTSGWSTDRNTLDWNDYPAGTTFNNLNLQENREEIIQNFEYLEIPVILKYKIVDRRMDFNILGGLSTNLLIGSNAYLMDERNKDKIGRTTDLKPVNYSSTVGVGMDYAISSKFNLNLEPFFKYYLNSINQSSAIRSRPYTLGVFTGISFVF